MTNVYGVVKNAVKNGRLIRQPCEVCGTPPGKRRRQDLYGNWVEREAIHAHHDDYSKPLEVRWLCTEHHEEHHRKERRLAAALGTTVEDLMGTEKVK